MNPSRRQTGEPKQPPSVCQNINDVRISMYNYASVFVDECKCNAHIPELKIFFICENSFFPQRKKKKKISWEMFFSCVKQWLFFFSWTFFFLSVSLKKKLFFTFSQMEKKTNLGLEKKLANWQNFPPALKSETQQRKQFRSEVRSPEKQNQIRFLFSLVSLKTSDCISQQSMKALSLVKH